MEDCTEVKAVLVSKSFSAHLLSSTLGRFLTAKRNMLDTPPTLRSLKVNPHLPPLTRYNTV